MPQPSNAISQVTEHFRVHQASELTQFVPPNSSGILGSVIAKARSIIHFFQTSVWIDKSALCSFAALHPELKMSSLFEGQKFQSKLVRYEHSLYVPQQSLFEMCMNGLKFIWQFITHRSTVGAILPSSGALAHEICSQIPKDPTAAKRLILEVGPGTGSFTDHIIKRMNSTDELHLVEYDEEFCKVLQERYKHIPNVKVFHRSITDHTPLPEDKYDHIVSGLPLGSFQPSFVANVFEKFLSLSHDGTTLSYFEYPLVPLFSQCFAPPEAKQKSEAICAIKDQFFEQHKMCKTEVPFNIPPARVLHHVLHKK